MAAFRFDDPWDERRFFRGGDNQIAGVGDGFARDLPPWLDAVKALYPDFPVHTSIALCGNTDVIAWADASVDELKGLVLTKLNAAKGGGYIFQSDHSAPSSISGERYDYMVRLVREHGQYPLQLGEFDLRDISSSGVGWPTG